MMYVRTLIIDLFSVELLEGLVSQVDARIRKSMSRIETPLPDIVKAST